MAVTNEQIARINELARKAKTTGLTPEEERERQALRDAYRAAFRQSLKSQLGGLRPLSDSRTGAACEASLAEPLRVPSSATMDKSTE